MPETRITNRTFFSNAIPRVPIIDASSPPTDLPAGGGGLVGQPTLSENITYEATPNITRVSHTRDIFVPLGTQMSISYTADSPCTLLPKGGYEDMVVSYSTDGLTMTLTWNCAADEPADSTYIGVEVWLHGSTATTEAYAVHWDRLHVGKVIGDLKYIGTDTAWPILYTALDQRTDYVAGDTVIITDGTYSNALDILGIGYIPDVGFNTSFPSGSSEEITHEGESFQQGIKQTNVMAQTPCGVLLDRQNRGGGVHLRGDARTGNISSGRMTQAINILGIDCLNHPNGFDITRADSCSINYSASVVDTNKDDVIGATYHVSVFGDSTNLSKSASRNCNFEYNLSFGNQRMLNLDGGGEAKGTWRGIFATNGATQVQGENRTQTFTGYGATQEDWLNCWAIDGGLFAGGIRDLDDGSLAVPNSVFITTNSSGHAFHGEGLLALNTVRSPIFSQSPSPKNTFKSCVFWQKLNVLNTLGEPINPTSFIAQGTHDLENITMGKNLSVASGTAHMINGYNAGTSLYTRLLAIRPIWDRVDADVLVTIEGGETYSDLYVVSTSSNLSPTLTATSGFELSAATPKDLGAHYISRIETGSVLDALANGRGCQNIFSAIGRYGKRYVDNSREVYDGTGGLPRVNKMARSPWAEFRTARQRYLCNSNDLAWSGEVGLGKPGVHPVDYINRFGTDPSTPENCPYIDDIYGVVDGTSVHLFWRPVCAALRETITSYSIYIDDALYLENVSPTAITYTIPSVTAGVRKFEIVCVDPTYGNSGKSTPVVLTV